jgi:tetratricopeptide (TPR) repeat protein
MLVPMIGLVQVGSQARADRFTYAAQIGVFVATIWLIADLWGARSRRWPSYVAAIVGSGFMLTTLRQVEYWTNGATLFERAIAVNDHNPVAHAQAGFARAQLGDHETAVAHYQNSLRLAPKFAKVWNHLAVSLLQLNRNDEAARAAQRALELDPQSAAARRSLSSARERMEAPAQDP